MPASSPPRPRRNLRQHQGLDDLCKAAMETDGGRLLALVFTPAVCRQLGLPEAEPRLLEILPTELRRKRQHADYLIKVDIGGQIVLLHIEFQNRVDSTMPLRIIQYQVAVIERHDLPVHSVVFNVLSDGPEAVVVETLRRGALGTHWVKVTVPQATRDWGPQVASPLGVLLVALLGNVSDEGLRRCLLRLQELGLSEQTCRELVEALCFLLDIRRKNEREATQKRLFMKLRMEETWLYQEGIEKGREEGMEKGMETGVETLRQTAIALCAERFGQPPDEQGIERIRHVREPGALSRLIIKLATAASLREALSILPAT